MLLHRFRQFAIVLGLILVASLGIAAQSQNPPPQPKTQDQPSPSQPAAQNQQSQAPAEDDNLQTFKAEVNVVNLFFNVKDKHGMLIPNLTKADFEVMEDGKPQTIKYFSAESNQPLTLGIMIDTSASQTRVLDIEQTSCAEFLRAVLRPKDLAFVINFDVDVDLDQDFTNNVHDLTRALNKVQIGAGMGGGPPGLGGGPIPTTPRGTLLYDAIYLRSRTNCAASTTLATRPAMPSSTAAIAKSRFAPRAERTKSRPAKATTPWPRTESRGWGLGVSIQHLAFSIWHLVNSDCHPERRVRSPWRTRAESKDPYIVIISFSQPLPQSRMKKRSRPFSDGTCRGRLMEQRRDSRGLIKVQLCNGKNDEGRVASLVSVQVFEMN